MTPPGRRASARRRTSRVAVAVVLVGVSAACDPGPAPELDIPPRPALALGGSELTRELAALDLAAREARIFEEVVSGNVPDHLRALRRVRMEGSVGGHEHRVVFWVMPDYLALGSDEDHVLMPLSPGMAQRIADRLGASLPTPAMVDAIWRAADVRLSPQRLSPRDSIGSVRTLEYIERHMSLILGQRLFRNAGPGTFVAGHKKDVVLSPELATQPGRVALYGMHAPDGTPNQPFSTVVAEELVYYNHGIRLVHRSVRVDDVDRDLRDVLTDPEVAPVLSVAGPMQQPFYPLRPSPPRGGAPEGP